MANLVRNGNQKLVSPITPFVTEDIYTKLTNEESIHLSNFPIYDESKVNEKIEKRMDLVRDLISLGRNAREEAKIKVRQPISNVILDGKNEELIKDLTDLIIEELNVKKVEFSNDLSKYMNLEVKPNYRTCGKMFGNSINNYAKLLQELSDDEINSLSKGLSINTKFNDEDLEISKEMVDIRVNSKEGYDAAYLNDNFIVINTTLSEELIMEGVARELVSKVQNLRKEKDFDIADRIILYYDGDIDSVINNFTDYIKKETLSIEIIKGELSSSSYDLNGNEVKINVERVKK